MTKLGGPQITIARKSGTAALMQRVLGITKMAAYVGVPAASTSARSEQLLGMAGKTTSKKKKARLIKAADTDINNAELLFIFSKGSPVKHIPARPVLEPAIAAQGNREPIARELAASIKASLGGDRAAALKKMQRAALAGQNAARSWFTDSRNGWKPNAQSTIDRKGSSRPGIDTGAMRAAIIGVVSEE
jgi:hypothetical protein